jgi:hypothetical protein
MEFEKNNDMRFGKEANSSRQLATSVNPTSENPTSENPTSENPTSENPTSENPTAEKFSARKSQYNPDWINTESFS